MWLPPSDLYRRFLIRAASNALTGSDARIYERAFDSLAARFAGPDGKPNPGAVKRLWVPSPAVFAASVPDAVSRSVDTAQLVRGLYLREYVQENPKAQVTLENFTETELRIAGLV